MAAAVLLCDPKYPHNVGGALRAAAVFGAERLRWTGDRVTLETTERRLPREERMKDYREVDFAWTPDPSRTSIEIQRFSFGYTPVAVELRECAEPLSSFEHPANALYVFGPEDGSLGGATLSACHRFVFIPSAVRTPLNLAAAVNVVLYDRMTKAMAADDRLRVGMLEVLS